MAFNLFSNLSGADKEGSVTKPFTPEAYANLSSEGGARAKNVKEVATHFQPPPDHPLHASYSMLTMLAKGHRMAGEKGRETKVPLSGVATTVAAELVKAYTRSKCVKVLMDDRGTLQPTWSARSVALGDALQALSDLSSTRGQIDAEVANAVVGNVVDELKAHLQAPVGQTAPSVLTSVIMQVDSLATRMKGGGSAAPEPVGGLWEALAAVSPDAYAALTWATNPSDFTSGPRLTPHAYTAAADAYLMETARRLAQLRGRPESEVTAFALPTRRRVEAAARALASARAFSEPIDRDPKFVALRQEVLGPIYGFTSERDVAITRLRDLTESLKVAAQVGALKGNVRRTASASARHALPGDDDRWNITT